MADYLCPAHVQDLWPDNRSKALVEFGKWVDTLTIGDSDRVWLPDIGWLPARLLRVLQSQRAAPAQDLEAV
jgi:hypothetical protein